MSQVILNSVLSELNITSAMSSPAALSVLERFVHAKTCHSAAFDEIEKALGSEFVEEDWENLMEFITFRRVAGFSELKQLLERQTFSEAQLSTAIPAAQSSLLTDVDAWQLVRGWVTEAYDFNELSKQMEVGFGCRYVPNEWSGIFDRIFEAFRLVDEGDATSLSASDIPTAKPLKALEDAMAAHHITFPPVSQKRRRSLPTCSSKSKGKRPAKRWKMTSAFLDLAAAEGNNTEYDDDDDEAREPHVTPAVKPAGQASFACDLNHIIRRYKDGRPVKSRGADVDRSSPPIAINDVMPSCEGGRAVYVIDFKISCARSFVRQFLERRGLKSWEVPMLPHQLYVEGSSHLHIRSNIPPSHWDIIHSIVLLPDDQHRSFRNTIPSIAPRSWVCIKQGIYRNDIGYVLSESESLFDLLVVPRRRPYDEIDLDDIAEVKAAKRMERKLFDPQYARDTGHQVISLNHRIGIVRCQGLEYHRGLLRRSYRQVSLETVVAPHPDQIAFHVEANINMSLTNRTHILFSSQFWKEGDRVRPQTGPFVGEVAKILALNLAQGSVSITLADSEIAVGAYDVPVLDLHRIFRHGDVVKVLAGMHRGFIGTVIGCSDAMSTIILEGTLEVGAVCSAFLETHLSQHVASLSSSHPGVAKLPPPHEGLDHAMLGDIATILRGEHSWRKGVVECLLPDGWMWLVMMSSTDAQISAKEQKQTSVRAGSSILVHSDEVRIEKPSCLLTYSKEKGYDVTQGDTLQIVRGEHCGITGIVRHADFIQGMVELVSNADARRINVPIQLCIKVSEFGLPPVTNAVGRDVWIVRGEKKGFCATLRSVGRDSCTVSLPGHYGIEMKRNHVCAESGILLDGTILDGQRLEQFKALVVRSFVPQQRSITPPHSPRQSPPIMANESEADAAWTITLADTACDPSHSAINKGCVKWLFEDKFCNFSRHHLSFNVNAGFAGGSFVKRIVRTTCPDRFCGRAGPAPHGSVSVTVTSNHSGRGIEHHNIPAHLLTPASPTSKGQLVLVLQGDLQGQFCQVFQWKRKEKVVVVKSTVADTKSTLPAEDVCLATSSI